MRLAHLIIAYKEPGQVERLVSRVLHEACDVYIHIDKKTDLRPFLYLAQNKQVRFIKNRQLIRWAGYSFTKAILTGMQEVLASGEYDFINLMSGQEYPLKPVDTMMRFFEQHRGSTFMTYEAEGSEWWQQNISRVNQYHSTDLNFKGQYLLQRCINQLLPKRKFPFSYTLYGGNCAMYWTMSRTCARYVVDFMEQHPQMERFARYTWAPDEFLISTILLNSPHRDTVINNNLRYIDWSQGGPNPKVLTLQDLDSLQKTSSFFARKFDIRQDSQILDKLDELMACQYEVI